MLCHKVLYLSFITTMEWGWTWCTLHIIKWVTERSGINLCVQQDSITQVVATVSVSFLNRYYEKTNLRNWPKLWKPCIFKKQTSNSNILSALCLLLFVNRNAMFVIYCGIGYLLLHNNAGRKRTLAISRLLLGEWLAKTAKIFPYVQLLIRQYRRKKRICQPIDTLSYSSLAFF